MQDHLSILLKKICKMLGGKGQKSRANCFLLDVNPEAKFQSEQTVKDALPHKSKTCTVAAVWQPPMTKKVCSFFHYHGIIITTHFLVKMRFSSSHYNMIHSCYDLFYPLLCQLCPRNYFSIKNFSHLNCKPTFTLKT